MLLSTDWLFAEEKGARAIEYAMLLSLIGVVVAVAAATIGVNLTALFTNVATSL